MKNRSNNLDNFFNLDDDINDINEEDLKQTKIKKEAKISKKASKLKSSKAFKIAGCAIIVALIPVTFITGIRASNISTQNINTLTQASKFEYKVKNKFIRDSSKNTVWTINGKEFNKGVNNTTVDYKLFTWGDNKIVAKNKNDTVEFDINLKKGIYDNDVLHTNLSLLLKYPDSCYSTYKKFRKIEQDTLTNLVYNLSDTVRYDNGLIKTKQYTNNKGVTLETTEKTGYSLMLGEPLITNSKYTGNKAVEVYGDWKDIKKATLYFNIGEENQDNYTACKFKDGKEYILKSSDVFYLNQQIYFDITEPGIYYVRENNASLDEHNMTNRFNVCIFKASNNDIICASDSDAAVDGTSENKADITGYNDTIQSMYDNVDKSCSLKTEKNTLILKDSVASIYNDKLKDIGENFDTSKCSLEYIIGKEFPMNKKYYIDNWVIVADLSKCGQNKATEIANLLKDFINSYCTSDYNILVIDNEKSDGLKALGNENKVYYVKSIADIKKYSENIYCPFKKENKQEIKLIQNGEDSSVFGYNITNSGFIFGANNLNSKCSFNEEMQCGNTYGQSLLTKLVFKGKLSNNLFKKGKCINADLNEFKDIMNIQTDQFGCEMKDSDIDVLNSQGFNNKKLDLTNESHMLNLAQLNNFSENLINIAGIAENDNYTFPINSICNQLNSGNLIMANVVNSDGYGAHTVLIVNIAQDTEKRNKFYVHMYDPANPDKDNIGVIETYRASDEDSDIGYGCNFSYECNECKFNELDIINKITIFNKEQVYSETFDKEG